MNEEAASDVAQVTHQGETPTVLEIAQQLTALERKIVRAKGKVEEMEREKQSIIELLQRI